MTKDIHYYMNLNYPIVVWQEKDDTAWFAKIPLLPGVMTHSETWNGLLAMVRDAKEGWLLSRLDHGWPISEPDFDVIP